MLTLIAAWQAMEAAMRPRIVGEALQLIGEDPEVLKAMFDILETQKILEGEARITLMPAGDELLPKLLASESVVRSGSQKAPPPLR